MKPTLIPGSHHQDHRGKLTFNNDFNAEEVKRIYTIQNRDTEFVRAWQGHSIELCWFSAVQGQFEIKLIEIDHWESPDKNLKPEIYQLNDQSLDVLAVPTGYVSSIQALTENAKLLVMADYPLGATNDEYRNDNDYFCTTKTIKPTTKKV